LIVQNHRTVGVGRRFWRWPSPTPSSGRLSYRLVRAMPAWVLIISTGGDFVTSLVNLCQCVITFTV